MSLPKPSGSMAGVPPPPRFLEVGRFAAARAGELRSLHEAVSARLGGRFQQARSARRRTTGHLPSKRRRRGGDAGAGEGEGERRDAARQSRRVRRRRELAGNPAEGFSVAGDGARRLRTHLWHAKRFSVERRWGFVLPVGAQGRGRGSRAVLKWLKNGTIVHDASYFIPIQLDGPEESLLSILRMLLHPSSSDETPNLKHRRDQLLRGVCYENAMLCHIEGPRLQIIGPVTYMWRPFSQENGKLEPKGDLTDSHRLDEGSCNILQRQLWIWIHPSALDQGLNAIRFACEKQMQDSGGKVNYCSLEGKFARLDVMGCKAMQSLKSILHPISKILSTSDLSTSTDPPLDSSTGSHVLKTSVLDHAEILYPGVILSMIVRDPRGDPREVSAQGMDSSKIVTPDEDNKLLEEDLVPNADGAALEEKNMLPSTWMHPARHHLLRSDCRELWDSDHKINPPMSEEIFCLEKHHRRIKFFCLDSGNDEGQASQEKDCFSQSCPVLILKHAKEGVLSLGWSVILPLSWVKLFWLCLVSHGAHAIGLRERRWIASKFKMPCFPYDYPDSKAYSLFMDKEAAAFDKAAECRPPSKRHPRIPVPPLWRCIMSSFCKGGDLVGGSEVDDLNHAFPIFPKCTLVNLNSKDVESTATNVIEPYQLVPRTIRLLRQYVKEFDVKYMSSLPDMETDTGEPNFISDGNANITCSASELCLVRVLIRAFKEGSFEEGAVVCAPFPSDLSAWKTRSEEEEEFVEKWQLQLPQSYVSSYFSWVDPTNRNLQLPNDGTAVKAFRWPVGFITTGFVHGSSGQDAVAVAFCEAKLLAALRREQWAHEGMQCQDIYVLVRNARSAAYRRALATIVLEQQEEDLEFL